MMKYQKIKRWTEVKVDGQCRDGVGQICNNGTGRKERKIGRTGRELGTRLRSAYDYNTK